MIPKITSRSDLLSLLSEACELEHGLACSYLYAAFSLKQDTSEDDIDWEQLQKIRLWAGQIYFIAAQEMLHLAQAWNLLAAIGGTPYYLRPNFPQNKSYYPIHAPLALEPFGHTALQRFLIYEKPFEEVVRPVEFLNLPAAMPTRKSRFGYETVGELYDLIASGVEEIPEDKLFIAPALGQVSGEFVDFPEIVAVTGKESALQAIEMIRHQGEGVSSDRGDCHFAAFFQIYEEFVAEEEKMRRQRKSFLPARNVIENPVARYRGDYGAPHGNLIEDPFAQQVAELFDAIYVLMLRMLSYVFSNATADVELRKHFSKTAIAAMTRVIKPLGEALMLLPAGARYGTKRAGPAFGMSRHVALPDAPDVARRLVEERILELIEVTGQLAQNSNAPAQLINSYQNLRELSA